MCEHLVYLWWQSLPPNPRGHTENQVSCYSFRKQGDGNWSIYRIQKVISFVACGKLTVCQGDASPVSKIGFICL